VYLIIGFLAILVALEHRGYTSGPKGAIARIGSQPFGQVLLVVVGVGLFGYASWCFIQALFDTDRDGKGFTGIAARVGAFCSGLGYVTLGFFAFHRMLGGGSADDGAQHWTARVLSHPWGAWAIGAIGLILIGAGIAQCLYAAREGFRKYLDLGGASASDRHWVVQFGKWGYSAQGVVLGVIGAFLVRAAVHADARQARGLDGALQSLAQQVYGPWILGLVAAGLAAYGIFMLIEARYRRLT
jgi:hypothetical protein